MALLRGVFNVSLDLTLLVWINPGLRFFVRNIPPTLDSYLSEFESQRFHLSLCRCPLHSTFLFPLLPSGYAAILVMQCWLCTSAKRNRLVHRSHVLPWSIATCMWALFGVSEADCTRGAHRNGTKLRALLEDYAGCPICL